MEISLNVNTRTESGKGPSRRLREQGMIPAVLYGTGIETCSLSVRRDDLRDVLRGEMGSNVLINLVVRNDEKAESHLVMIKELQRHPLKDELLHADFVKVARDEKVTTRVSLLIEGQEDSVGLKTGGTLQHVLWEVEVECLPADLPEHVVADISELDLGESLKVGDLKPLPGVSVLNDPEDSVLNVLAPRLADELEEEEVEGIGAAVPTAGEDETDARGGE